MKCECGAEMTRGYLWDNMEEPRMAEVELPEDMSEVESYFEEYDCPECGEGLIISHARNENGEFVEDWRDKR